MIELQKSTFFVPGNTRVSLRTKKIPPVRLVGLLRWKKFKNNQEDFIDESGSGNDNVSIYGGCGRRFHHCDGDRNPGNDHLENIQKNQVWLQIDRLRQGERLK